MDNIDNFMQVINNITSIPETFFNEQLSKAIKHADGSVYKTFFSIGAPIAIPPDELNYLITNHDTLSPELQKLSVEYLSYLVSKNTSHGFNKTINNGTDYVIDNWFLKNSVSIGQSMFVDYMMQAERLGAYFANPSDLPVAIADDIASSDFLTAHLIQLDTSGSQLPAKVLLFMLKILDNNGPNYRKVHSAWTLNEQWDSIEDFDRYAWLDGCKPSFIQGGPVFTTFNNIVKSQINASTVSKYKKEIMDNPAIQFGIHEYEDRIKTVYGAKVADWLKNPNGPAKYGLNSGTPPNNVTDVLAPKKSSGCYIAGTPILMADGSSKAIEKIQEGDHLLNTDGIVSICSAAPLPNPLITCLYSINDMDPFMTMEHAIMTQRGWCSLAPDLSRELTPHREVHMLKEGDVAWQVAGVKNGKAIYKKVIVEKVNAKYFAEGEGPVGYALHQRNGHHTNHANGFCCLVGYPEITMHWLSSNIASNMSHSEQLRFQKELERITPQLEKALGRDVTKLVKVSLKNANEISAKSSHTNAIGKLKKIQSDAQHIILPHMNVNTIKEGDKLPTDLEKISLYNGHVFINDQIVETWHDKNHIYWNRENADGQIEKGFMKMAPHGLLGFGSILTGQKSVSFIADGMVGYTILDAEQKPWLSFEMGFIQDEKGNFHASGQVTNALQRSDIGTDISSFSQVIFSVVENKSALEVLEAKITFDPDIAALYGFEYSDVSIDFSMDYKTFTGTATRSNDGSKMPVSGSSVHTDTLASMQKQVTNTMAKAKFSTQFLQTNIQEDNKPAANFDTSWAANTPSVNDLYLLPTPDLENVHQLAFGKLKDLMLHALDKNDNDWLAYFGESAPTVGESGTLNQQVADLIDNSTIKDFLIDKFAIGYLTKAFSASDEPKIKAKFSTLADLDNKQNYFWSGDGDESFAKSKGYSLASSKINDFAYAISVPGFYNYLNNNPADWAKQLYEFCMVPETKNGLALTTTLDGKARLTHLSSMLHALDSTPQVDVGGKKITYSTALYNAILDVQLKNIQTYSKTANSEDLSGFLTAYLKQYFASILDPSSKWQDAIRSEAKKELENLMEEYNVDSASELVDAMGEVIADGIELLISIPEQPFALKLKELFEKVPALSKISTAITIGLYGYGFYSVITTFMSWKELEPQQKVAAITNAVDIVFSIFNDLTTWKAAKVLANINETPIKDAADALKQVKSSVSEVEIVSVKSTENLAIAFDSELSIIDSPVLARGASAASNSLSDIFTMDEQYVKWETISTVGEVVAKSITIIALAAGAVATGFQIANDFATNQPPAIKAFDIISEISTGVAFLVEAGSGIAALAGAEVLAFIPVVGTIAAGLGIVASIVLMFIHRNPPPSPAEVFVDQHCVPFINNLPSPPDEWLAKQKKIADHLGGAS